MVKVKSFENDIWLKSIVDSGISSSQMNNICRQLYGAIKLSLITLGFIVG
jgi:hypothetical protein